MTGPDPPTFEERVEAALDQIQTQLDTLDAKLDALDLKLDKLERIVEGQEELREIVLRPKRAPGGTRPYSRRTN